MTAGQGRASTHLEPQKGIEKETGDALDDVPQGRDRKKRSRVGGGAGGEGADKV